MKKLLAMILALATVFTLAACSVDDDGGSSKKSNESYEEALDIFTMLMAGEELTQKQVRRMQPEDYISYMEEQGNRFSDYYEDVQQQVKTNANAVTSVFGKDYEVSYEITEDEKMSNEDQAQATKRLNSEPWYEAREVDEVRQLVLEISIEGENTSRTFEADIQVMQYGDGWYILSFTCPEMEALLG